MDGGTAPLHPALSRALRARAMRITASHTEKQTHPGVDLTQLSPLTCHLSPVTCHLSPVTCHLSPVTCHLSPVTCHLSPVTCHLSPDVPLVGVPGLERHAATAADVDQPLVDQDRLRVVVERHHHQVLGHV